MFDRAIACRSGQARRPRRDDPLRRNRHRQESGRLARRTAVATIESHGRFDRPDVLFKSSDRGDHVYNNAQGGAPNQRYITGRAMRGQMIAHGWVPEGLGRDGVQMCTSP
jgi:hypothetical protein